MVKLKSLIIYLFSFSKEFFFQNSGDVRLGVIDTVGVRLNLVGKRVQVSEDAENFQTETTKKGGIVQVQGFITDRLAGSSIDVNAPKGTVQLDVRDWFSTLKLDKHVNQ